MNMMTKRTIWILNFSATLVVFIVIIVGSMLGLASDKGIIIVFFLIAALLYLGGIVYLFYNGIYKWETKQAQSFYGASFPIAALSIFLLIGLIRDMASELTLPPASEILAIVICGLNAVTFCWGLITKRN
jgi:hypothetical protein